MLISKLRSIVHRLRKKFRKQPDHFLKKCKGIIHVGANAGQEAEFYNQFGLSVLWIEPIPYVFEQLTANIRAYPLQSAIKALVTDRDGESYQFKIANNNGASSSIFEMKDHKEIWPTIEYTETIDLQSSTLESLLKKHDVPISRFDALIMDTQGSELLVLKGATSIVRNFKFIKTEVADFESYEGCCQFEDIDGFMKEHGFQIHSREKFAGKEGTGNYWDVVYRSSSR